MYLSIYLSIRLSTYLSIYPVNKPIVCQCVAHHQQVSSSRLPCVRFFFSLPFSVLASLSSHDCVCVYTKKYHMLSAPPLRRSELAPTRRRNQANFQASEGIETRSRRLALFGHVYSPLYGKHFYSCFFPKSFVTELAFNLCR